MKNNYKLLLLVPVAMLILLFGCRQPAKTVAVQKALFGLHLHTYIGDSTVNTSSNSGIQYGQWYKDKNGRWLNITNANIYLSNIGVHSATTGQWYTLPGSVMLKRLEQEQYAIDSVPVDNYDNVRFTIGLGSALNGGMPSSYSSVAGADTVLSGAESVMYAGASKGYYFISVTGNIDTSSSRNMAHPFPFVYQLTTDTLQVSPPSASQNNTFPIVPGVPGAQYVHIIFDYGKLLQSIPVTAPVNLQFTAPAPVLDSIIRYECSSPGLDC